MLLLHGTPYVLYVVLDSSTLLEFITYYTKLSSGMQYHCLLTDTEKYIYHLSWVIKFFVWSNILYFNQSDMYVQFL